MGKYIRKPSSFLYDESKSIDEIMGDYVAFLNELSIEDLRHELNIKRSDWLSLPTIFNVRAYMKCKEKMLERESIVRGSESTVSALEL